MRRALIALELACPAVLVALLLDRATRPGPLALCDLGLLAAAIGCGFVLGAGAAWGGRTVQQEGEGDDRED